MRYDEFKDWLRARGVSANSVNIRASTVKSVEREMSSLGSVSEDLDGAYDADKFAQLRHAFDELRIDARAGGQRFRILFPTTANALSRNVSTKTMLGQYAQFRAGATPDLAISLDPNDSYWFVGASFGRTQDQVERFLNEGIWEVNTPTPAEADIVRSMQVGDRIAIKAAFVQRLNLPFDNRDQNVSVNSCLARKSERAQSAVTCRHDQFIGIFYGIAREWGRDVGDVAASGNRCRPAGIAGQIRSKERQAIIVDL
jgi:hypothetical protein